MPVQTLVERVLHQERLDLRHRAAMPPRAQVCLDRELACLEAKILELADRGHRERLVRDIGQRRTTPQGQSAPEDLSGAAVVAGLELLPALPQVSTENVDIQLGPTQPQQIAVRDR